MTRRAAMMTTLLALVKTTLAQKQRAVKKPSPPVVYGRFEGKLEVELISGGQIKLLRPFSFVDRYDKRWTAPEGMISDGASIPQWAWSFIGGPFDGDYRDAAVIHDCGCVQRKAPWVEVHRTFLYGLLARNVDPVKSYTMYAAVYHFGPRWKTGSQKAPPYTMIRSDFPALANRIKTSIGDIAAQKGFTASRTTNPTGDNDMQQEDDEEILLTLIENPKSRLH